MTPICLPECSKRLSDGGSLMPHKTKQISPEGRQLRSANNNNSKTRFQIKKASCHSFITMLPGGPSAKKSIPLILFED